MAFYINYVIISKKILEKISRLFETKMVFRHNFWRISGYTFRPSLGFLYLGLPWELEWATQNMKAEEFYEEISCIIFNFLAKPISKVLKLEQQNNYSKIKAGPGELW